MITIEQYRTAQEVCLPRNGEGEQLPQLIDDLYSAREALSAAVVKSGFLESHKLPRNPTEIREKAIFCRRYFFFLVHHG